MKIEIDITCMKLLDDGFNPPPLVQEPIIRLFNNSWMVALDPVAPLNHLQSVVFFEKEHGLKDQNRRETGSHEKADELGHPFVVTEPF